jgi:hypothetical protein
MKPTTNRLIRRGNPMGSAACRQSHKSASCHVATEWQGGKTNMRMKPELVKRQSCCTLLSNDGRQLQTSCCSTLTEHRYVQSRRTNYETTAISGLKDGNRIRQFVKQIVITHLNGDCLNQNAVRLWSTASEYLTWQRSSHSSPSKGKPCTWRRGTIGLL